MFNKKWSQLVIKSVMFLFSIVFVLYLKLELPKMTMITGAFLMIVAEEFGFIMPKRRMVAETRRSRFGFVVLTSAIIMCTIVYLKVFDDDVTMALLNLLVTFGFYFLMMQFSFDGIDPKVTFITVPIAILADIADYMAPRFFDGIMGIVISFLSSIILMAIVFYWWIILVKILTKKL